MDLSAYCRPVDESIRPRRRKSKIVPNSLVARATTQAMAKRYSNASVLLRTLVRCCNRWRSVRFSLPSHLHFPPLAAIAKSNVPMLRFVVIDTPIHERMDRILSFLGTPSLHSASLQMIGYRAPLHWEGLRHLLVDSGFVSLASNEVLGLLQQCPRLETCSLSVGFRSLPVDPPQSCHLQRRRRGWLQFSLGPFSDEFAFPGISFGWPSSR
ncbi:hypothetical protein B0H19DRAFT_1142316 [Mycena capillaripes]|nr:hypothetical protein B0H19DRAFT_1142316 [Mycena capillaripes]